MRSKVLLAVVVSAGAIAAAGSAAAQSVDPRPFNGPYIAASGGFDAQPNDVGESIKFDRNLDGQFGDTITTTAGANAFSTGFCNGEARGNTSAPGCTNDRDSYSYAGRIGYDRQMGNVVVGLVGEFGTTNIRDAVTAFSTTPASYTMSRTIRYTGNIRARAGYAFDKSLFYATGGGLYGRVRNRFSTTNTVNTFTGNGDKNAYGFAVGGGMEQKLGRHLSIGVEYLFNRLTDKDYRVRVSGGPATSPFLLGNASGTDLARSDEKFHWHSVRAVAAFRF